MGLYVEKINPTTIKVGIYPVVSGKGLHRKLEVTEDMRGEKTFVLCGYEHKDEGDQREKITAEELLKRYKRLVHPYSL